MGIHRSAKPWEPTIDNYGVLILLLQTYAMSQVIELLTKVGAILPNDHFVGTSGKHFAMYINKDALYPHTAETAEVGQMFAKAFAEYAVDVVAGPALGGIILSQWTASSLSTLESREVLSVYAEKKPNLKLTRGYDTIVKGKRVAVVEDLTTTGGSLREVIDAVQSCGGEVVVAGVMVNKNPAQVNSESLGVPFISLGEAEVVVFDAEECTLCADSVPVNTTIGHGQKFVEAQ